MRKQCKFVGTFIDIFPDFFFVNKLYKKRSNEIISVYSRYNCFSLPIGLGQLLIPCRNHFLVSTYILVFSINL